MPDRHIFRNNLVLHQEIRQSLGRGGNDAIPSCRIVIVIGLAVYLFLALLKPEWFQ